MDKWYFDMAEKYFNLKIYEANDVRLFVEAERITKEQFKEITGEDYDKPTKSLPIKLNENK